MAEKVEALLEKRLLEVTIVVANTVSNKLMKAMEKMLNKNKAVDSNNSEQESRLPIIQESPQKMGEAQAMQRDEENTNTENETNITDSTMKMLVELDDIEAADSNNPDPSHDKQQGSEEDVK